MGEPLILEEGKKDCEHSWRDDTEDWEESLKQKPSDPEWYSASYHATVRICTECGRKELTGGTVLFPEIPGRYVSGEYTLQPDAQRGLFIS